VVRYERVAPAADFAAVTHFYWHTGRDTLCFLTLINNDIVEKHQLEEAPEPRILTG
jgi:hypothetical protein